MKDLDNTDLILEFAQLKTFEALADKYEVNVDDFNHDLLEDWVDDFARSIETAIWMFKKAIYERQATVMKELTRRGITDIEVR